MKRYLSIALLSFVALSNFSKAQDILELKDGTSQQKADIKQLSWLVGNWIGSGFGGRCEELWMPAGDNSMQGIFRFYENKKLQFTEYMHIVLESDSTISVKLKHFNADLSAWEEKEKWTIFKLIKIENQTAYLNGLTYSRTKNKLLIKLRLHDKEKVWTEEFVLRKAKF